MNATVDIKGFNQLRLELFEKKNEHQYNLRNNSEFTIPPLNSVYYGIESVSFLGPKVWDILSDKSKVGHV